MRRLVGRGDESRGWLPTPTARFRRRAWLDFQRALDPFAAPRPWPMRRRRD
ncbi:MAG TPA: hypothetical protein VGN27_11385 [Gaiellaceae bacterium]|nr:hypothetical protein [Gaiellaceae bacterium]